MLRRRQESGARAGSKSCPRYCAIVIITAALYAALGGSASLLGYVFDIPWLTDWSGTGISIQPNAAVCVVLSGLGLFALGVGGRTLAAFCGGGVLVIGGGTLLEWVTGLSFGHDGLLLFGREWGRVGVVVPGRMGPPGSVCWTLIGTALLLTAVAPSSPRWGGLAAKLVLGTLLISALSLIGYLYDVDRLFALPRATVIALQTSTFIAAVSMGILAAHPDREPVSTLADPGAAGVLARRVMPAVLFAAVGIGYLRIEGEDAGWYDGRMGVALYAVALSVVLMAALWRSLLVVRRHDRALRESESRLRSIIDQLPAGVGVMDTAGRWMITNSAMDRYVPAAIPSTLPDQAAWRFWDEAGRGLPPEHWPIRRALRGESVLPGMEGLYTEAGGREVWMRVSAAPLFDAKGTIIGATAVVQDIDLPKRFNARLRGELEKQAAELAAAHDRIRRTEAMTILGSLSGGVAHDLGNLLLPLRSHLDVMRRSDLAPDLRESARAIETNIGYIGALAQRLRGAMTDLAREGGIAGGGVAAEPSDASRWCREAEPFLRSIVPPPVALTCEVPPGLPLIRVNKVGLTQAVYNLVQNSVNAMRRSRVGRTIRLRAAMTEGLGGRIELIVEDDGPGMTPEVRARCLESRLSPDAAGGEGGMGLGLSLVKAFAHESDGEIEVFSPSPWREGAEANGTAVVIRIPVYAPEITIRPKPVTVRQLDSGR